MLCVSCHRGFVAGLVGVESEGELDLMALGRCHGELSAVAEDEVSVPLMRINRDTCTVATDALEAA